MIESGCNVGSALRVTKVQTFHTSDRGIDPDLIAYRKRLRALT